MNKIALSLSTCALLAGLTLAAEPNLEQEYDQTSRRAAPRDGFPVLNQPKLVTAAEAAGKLADTDWIIGLELAGESRAYPIAVMGRHELANDVCGGKPVAVSW